ncbi:MAG TPA: methylenetetrahydrofolate--tRNA-(uracil(54)-C(5))-methyltransferase (FADH(2)-oxidizing) TrmFO [Armatimonadota bacterium]
MSEVVVVGGGLAGSEAAWQAAEAGADVTLYEMRPVRSTPAHQTGFLAELVCSNSFKGKSLTSAHGLLKAEMRRLGSVLLPCADETAVPAGEALAVDVPRFAELVTRKLESHPRVTVRREEVTELPRGTCVIATGPLTSDALSARIAELAGGDHLYFYDAIAPSVAAESIDREVAFLESRWGKGEAAYLNCPMDEAEYTAFREALLGAELVAMKDFEPMHLFEGCLPIEELARRGELTMAYGPLKPVGLTDPRTGRRPFAVVQLRQENVEGSVFSLVGFQTRLRYPEQKRVFRLIPGLEGAEIARYGQMHRNTYLDSPRLLEPTLRLKSEHAPGRDSPLFFAGQMVGVEGYLESAAMGLLAGRNAAGVSQGQEPLTLPEETMMGGLARYVCGLSSQELYPKGKFPPMNSNFGLLPPLESRTHKKDRPALQIERALQALDGMIAGDR